MCAQYGYNKKNKVDRGETRHLQVTKHNNYHLPQIIYGLVCEKNSSVELTFCLFTLYLLSLIGTIILLHVCVRFRNLFNETAVNNNITTTTTTHLCNIEIDDKKY